MFYLYWFIDMIFVWKILVLWFDICFVDIDIWDISYCFLVLIYYCFDIIIEFRVFLEFICIFIMG